MLTPKMIAKVLRMEESFANSRAGLWRCGECGVLYPREISHTCEHEDLERFAEARREIGTGALPC